METLKDKQTLKKGLIEIAKQIKGLKDRVFNVRYSNGNFWIYDGLILTTKVFNLHYAKERCKVKNSSLKTDEVYIISEILGSQKQIFGI